MWKLICDLQLENQQGSLNPSGTLVRIDRTSLIDFMDQLVKGEGPVNLGVKGLAVSNMMWENSV